MKKDTKNFLLDDDFIRWRLTGDAQLTKFWNSYTECPEEKDALADAIRQFQKIRLNDERLSHADYTQLLQRIKTSVSQTGSKKRIYRLWLRYAAAACLMLAVGLSAYHLLHTPIPDTTLLTGNIIVGESLDDENIHLITGAETVSFTGDIDVRINRNGSVSVQESGSAEPKQMGTGRIALNKIVVPYGKRSRIELSDGTKVWINSGSTLEFPAEFTGMERNISVSGEIYLEVARDKQRPFIVSASGMDVKVYGTSFCVSAYIDVQAVVLAEGQVGVKIPVFKDETILLPNERLSFQDNRLIKEIVDVREYTCWKDGYIFLKQTPVMDMLSKLERYYNLSFDVRGDADALRHITCTGKIRLSDDIDDVMKTLSALSATTYERDGKNIYIKY
jgi:ferric-dicitrate binding protein FerR (iron transport regulator)